MFRLTEKTVDFLNMTTRDEKHGDKEVTAHDLKFRVDLPNRELAMFSDQLLTALYMPEDDAPDLLGDAPLTRLRLGAGVEEIQWSAGELVGATLVMHYGIDTELRFGESKVNNYRIEPKSGGTVSLTFRVQVYPDPDKIAHDSGLLTEMRARGVATITIIPPEPKSENAEGDLADQAGQQSESRKEAEGLFGGGDSGDSGDNPPAAAGRRRAPAKVE